MTRVPLRLSFPAAVLLCALGCAPEQSVSTTDGAPLPVKARRIVLGMPRYSAEDAVDATHALAGYLSNALGIVVDVRMAEPYKELPALLRTGAIDIAQLPPLAYVHLKQVLPGVVPIATPIAAGSPTYLGHIYVREDSRYRSVADLRGARMAYVSPESTSGYLFARELLREKGVDPDQIFINTRFFGTHQDVLNALVSGEADAGASVDSSAGGLVKVERPAGLRVIGKTARIPHDCVVARDGLDGGTIYAFRRALLQMRVGEPAAAGVLVALRLNGWVAAEESRYDRIRVVLAKEGR